MYGKSQHALSDIRLREVNLKLFWLNDVRKISDLVPHQKNPRRLTDKQYKDLKKSLEKFNLAEVPAINLDNTILAGHQRLKILAQLEGPEYNVDVRIPNRMLTQAEVDEYLIRSNKNTGEWDFDLLANEWEQDDLLDWGFEESEFSIEEAPNFLPSGEEGQGKLDELKIEIRECPECGAHFEIKQAKIIS